MGRSIRSSESEARVSCEVADCTRPVRAGSRCDRHAVYVPPPPKAKRELETPIKKRCHAAVMATGHVIGWIHDVDYRLGKTGLGLGTSDTIYVVAPFGRFLGIEYKRVGYSPSDVSPAQRAWLAAVRKFGGVSGIATCEAEALALLAEARHVRSPDAIPNL